MNTVYAIQYINHDNLDTDIQYNNVYIKKEDAVNTVIKHMLFNDLIKKDEEETARKMFDDDKKISLNRFPGERVDVTFKLEEFTLILPIRK